LATRANAIHVDSAVWVIDQLKQIYINAELQPMEAGTWYAKVARRDYSIAINVTGLSVDNPDVNFYENYGCGSQRNYSDYCLAELERMVDRQSSETDPRVRLKLVNAIDLQLQLDGARPILRHRLAYTAYYRYVRNFINHQSVYNNFRFQEVWLNK